MAEYNIDSIVMPNGEAQEITAIVMPNGDEYTFGGGVTPTGNIDITQAGVTDVTNYATATVPTADPWIGYSDTGFFTENNQRKWHTRPVVSFDERQVGWMDTDTTGNFLTYDAVPTGTTVTPTESAQTIGGARRMMEGAVTVNAIPSNYVGSGVARNDSTDLTASGATVTAPAGYYETAASKTVAAGTEGTPVATKGAVSNHAVTVTPSVTNQAGYIAGGTKTGTGVQVTAAELVSGTLSITENGTDIDVTNYQKVNVAVPSSGGGGITQDANGYLVLDPDAGGGGGSSTPSVGSFSITATDATAATYCGLVTLVSVSYYYYTGDIPILAKLNSAGITKTARWYLDDDGYMYVSFYGASDGYWPVVSAISGTALQVGSSNAGTASVGDVWYKQSGAYVWYRISDGAVLSLSWRNNN